MARETTDFRGIIIYRRDYRERDLLIKILTDRIGPAMFYVRDAKKRGFRLASDILPFTHGSYIGSLDNHGLSFINTASETHQYQHIAGDLSRNAYATYILALVDHAFTDGQPLGGWFDQVAAALALIDRGQDEQVVTNVIETQLLTVFGVAPTWDRCVICGRADRPLDFSEQYGGCCATVTGTLTPAAFTWTGEPCTTCNSLPSLTFSGSIISKSTRLLSCASRPSLIPFMMTRWDCA